MDAARTRPCHGHAPDTDTIRVGRVRHGPDRVVIADWVLPGMDTPATRGRVPGSD